MFGIGPDEDFPPPPPPPPGESPDDLAALVCANLEIELTFTQCVEMPRMGAKKERSRPQIIKQFFLNTGLEGPEEVGITVVNESRGVSTILFINDAEQREYFTTLFQTYLTNGYTAPIMVNYTKNGKPAMKFYKPRGMTFQIEDLDDD